MLLLLNAFVNRCCIFLVSTKGEQMSTDNKWKIRQKRRELVKYIIPRDLVIKLKEKEIIDETEMRSIQSHLEMGDQVDSLLKILVTKQNSSFPIFVQSLHETFQSHIANLLQEGTDNIICWILNVHDLWKTYTKIYLKITRLQQKSPVIKWSITLQVLRLWKVE